MILQPKKIIPLFGIEHGMTVMDVGSGIGFWAKLIAEYVGQSGTVIAVDNHSETLTRLHNDAKDMGITTIHGVCADIRFSHEIPIKKHTCDRIVMIRVMSILHDQLSTHIQDFASFLSDRGQIIVIDSAVYRDDILAVLSDSTLVFEEMPLVSERSDHYYFGVKIFTPNTD